MPVVVVSAQTPLGRLVVARLRAEGAEVRALVDSPAADLGVPTALTEWDEEERVGAVFEGAHTVVALGGGTQARRVHPHLRDAGVRRLIVVTGPDERVPPGVADAEVVVVRRRTAERFWRRPSERDLAALADEVVAADRRE
ncbi:MAG TPA: NAD(P)H-binding protein [Frankiaceae bacterium]|nr:NAD(P)H-binding protein [Frankiaceae bacterium]